MVTSVVYIPDAAQAQPSGPGRALFNTKLIVQPTHREPASVGPFVVYNRRRLTSTWFAVSTFQLSLAMSDLESFHLFPLLPAEIRLEIWQHSCWQPRVVEVYYDAEADQCATTTPQPATLYACSESRREASRVYKLLFGTLTHDAKIYFHPEIDTLYIPRPPFMGYDDNARDFAQLATGASDIVNLALDHVNPAIRRPWETYNKYALMQSFPKVMEVYLVLDTNTGNGIDNDNDRTKHGFLRLAEPAGDPTDVCKLLQDVKMSFTYEVGTSFGNEDKDEGLPEPPALVLKSKVEIDYVRLL